MTTSTATFVSERRAAWVLLAPLTFFFAIFFALPIVLAAVQSFQETKVSGGLGIGGVSTVFAGFDNYVAVLTDGAILQGFLRVLLLGVIQVPVMMAIAILMALLFDAGIIWGRQFFQTAAFLPHAIPGVIAALIWGGLYLPQISPIVKGLAALGIKADFLGNTTVLFSVMNITTWEWIGYNMIILYAALQSVPREILESARVEGAGGIRIALSIKLPLIVPALVISLAFSIIGSIQQFASPVVLSTFTSNIDSKFTPNMAVFTLAGGDGVPQRAYALAMVIALLAFVLSFAVLRIRDRTESNR
ncbi:MAG TPA: sugar ABC transporter permease [Pseudolysinimonas sp.]|nr:sugar ABC transporter permease [Pseudolysinimonas sp.]